MQAVEERGTTSTWSAFWGRLTTTPTAGSPPPAVWGGFMASSTSHVRASHTLTVPSLDALTTCTARGLWGIMAS